jgi:hypothetical protein
LHRALRTMSFWCSPPHNQFAKSLTGYVWLCFVMFGYWQLHRGEKIGAKTVQLCKASSPCSLSSLQFAKTLGLRCGCGGATPQPQSPNITQNGKRITGEAW